MTIQSSLRIPDTGFQTLGESRNLFTQRGSHEKRKKIELTYGGNRGLYASLQQEAPVLCIFSKACLRERGGRQRWIAYMVDAKLKYCTLSATRTLFDGWRLQMKSSSILYPLCYCSAHRINAISFRPTFANYHDGTVMEQMTSCSHTPWHAYLMPQKSFKGITAEPCCRCQLVLRMLFMMFDVLFDWSVVVCLSRWKMESVDKRRWLYCVGWCFFAILGCWVCGFAWCGLLGSILALQNVSQVISFAKPPHRMFRSTANGGKGSLWSHSVDQCMCAVILLWPFFVSPT